jgi:ribosome-associated protein
MLKITDGLAIPLDELRFTASLSSGPGGQNVNRVHTRITLWFDVVNSPSLSEDQKALILRRLASRVSKEGVLRVVSQETRSQAANREAASERFVELLRTALQQEPARRKTRVSRMAKLKRLAEKRRRSVLKRERTRRLPIED